MVDVVVNLTMPFDEMRAFLRPQSQHNQWLSLQQRRGIRRERFPQLMKLRAVAEPKSYQFANLL